MMEKDSLGYLDPFGYPLLTYVWVVGLSCIAGIVKYINSPGTFSWRYALRDVITAAFTGLLTFWICEYYKVGGSMQAVCIAVSAVMGNRAWVEFENILRLRLGMPLQQQQSAPQEVAPLATPNPTDVDNSGVQGEQP